MYITAPDLVEAVGKGAMFDEDITMHEALRSRDLLMIDDLGAELGVSSSDGQKTVNLIRHRVNHEKATILATSLSEERLGRGYGPELLPLLRSAFTFMRTSCAPECRQKEEISQKPPSSPKQYSRRDDSVFKVIRAESFKSKTNNELQKSFIRDLKPMLGHACKGDALRSILNRIRRYHKLPSSRDVRKKAVSPDL
jgi:hypothetical protein